MRPGSESARAHDTWASGDAYEPYVGRWSRLIAAQFLDWLAVPEGKAWLDVACGTGALTDTILHRANPARIKGIDASKDYVAYAGRAIQDPRVTFEVEDAQQLQEPAGAYDMAVCALALNFVPQPERAASEMARVVLPGGQVAAYVWDHPGRMEFMQYFWAAAAALDRRAADLDEGHRFQLCQPAPLQQLFEKIGLEQVEVRPIDIDTHFTDFDDYWSPFLGGQGPAPGYVMSLGEEARLALRERLRLSLPIAADGSVPLVARAWAVRGTRREGAHAAEA